jgi:hypothetical protein
MRSVSRVLKLSFVTLLAGFSGAAQASEIRFLSDPPRVIINNGENSRIAAGETVTVKYDQSRLSTCNSDNRMYQSFLTLSYDFGDGETHTVQLAGSGEISKSIFVPKETHTLTMWFRNFTLTSSDAPPVCDVYDSAGGQNYKFPVQN